MKFDGFDMILNGCALDTLSIYKDGDYFQLNIITESPEGKADFFHLLSRDELVELKSKLELLVLHTDSRR